MWYDGAREGENIILMVHLTTSHAAVGNEGRPEAPILYVIYCLLDTNCVQGALPNALEQTRQTRGPRATCFVYLARVNL